jgi:MraZ protein
MTSFIGEFQCKVDPKGRIVLPSALKKQMSADARDSFIVKKDIFERCLVLFPLDEWERQVALIRSKLNPYNKEHNLFIREFYKGTAELVLDTNNRMLIPKRLYDLVGIETDVFLAGQDGKIEIWAKEAYSEVIENEEDFAKLAEKILGGDTLL